MFQNSISTIFLACCFPFFLNAQSVEVDADAKSQIKIHAKVAVGIFKKQGEPTYSTFETSFGINAGINFSGGIGYHYFLRKKISLSASALYEFTKTSGKEKYNYTFPNGDFTNSTILEKYSTHAILLPIKAYFHFKHFNLSTGIINTFHLATKINVDQNFYLNNELVQEISQTYKAGGYNEYGEAPFMDWDKTDLERKINFQFIAGLHFPLGTRFQIDFEFRQYLMENLLVREIHNYDVVNNFFDTYEPFGKFTTVGLRWLIFEQ